MLVQARGCRVGISESDVMLSGRGAIWIRENGELRTPAPNEKGIEYATIKKSTIVPGGYIGTVFRRVNKKKSVVLYRSLQESIEDSVNTCETFMFETR
jgi:hypothetical protein